MRCRPSAQRSRAMAVTSSRLRRRGLLALGVEGVELREQRRYETDLSEFGFLDHHPNRSEVSMIAGDTIAVFDTTDLDSGVLRPVDRFALPAGSAVDLRSIGYGPDGTIYTTGATSFFAVSDGTLLELHSPVSIGAPFSVEPFEDGTVLLGGFSDGVLIDPTESRVVAGPFQAPGRGRVRRKGRRRPATHGNWIGILLHSNRSVFAGRWPSSPRSLESKTATDFWWPSRMAPRSMPPGLSARRARRCA